MVFDNIYNKAKEDLNIKQGSDKYEEMYKKCFASVFEESKKDANLYPVNEKEKASMYLFALNAWNCGIEFAQNMEYGL